MTDPVDLDRLDALFANTFRSDMIGARIELDMALHHAWPAISAELRRLRAEKQPTINVNFTCSVPGYPRGGGVRPAKIKSVEQEDDGSWTVNLDEWPEKIGVLIPWREAFDRAMRGLEMLNADQRTLHMCNALRALFCAIKGHPEY